MIDYWLSIKVCLGLSSLFITLTPTITPNNTPYTPPYSPNYTPHLNLGVKRNMRGAEAKTVCPDLILVQVPTDHEKADLSIYREAGVCVCVRVCVCVCIYVCVCLCVYICLFLIFFVFISLLPFITSRLRK